MARISKQFDQDKIYRTTISARNQFTEEFARQWTDAEIRILAFIKYQFRRDDRFSYAGEAAAQCCLVSRRTWINTIQKLELKDYISVGRGKFTHRRNLINCYLLGENLKKILKYAHTQLRHINAPSAASSPKFSKKQPEQQAKKITPHCAMVAQYYNLNNINNTSLPTSDIQNQNSGARSVKSPVIGAAAQCRSAAPPLNGVEHTLLIADLEAKLASIRQFEIKQAVPAGGDPPPLDRNGYFWAILTQIDADLSAKMLKNRFGMVDGLAVLRREFMPDLGFPKLLNLLDKHGACAAFMVVAVAYRVKFKRPDERGRPIMRPAAYLIGALSNQSGARPLMSLSYFKHDLSLKKPSSPEIKQARIEIARSWMEALSQAERMRLYDKHQNPSSFDYDQTFARNMDDPVWMIRAYDFKFRCDWSGLAHLKD